MLNKLLIMLLTAVLLTVAGATTSMAGPGGHGGGHGGGNGGGNGGNDGGGNCCDSDDLSKDEIQGLLFMREEEKVARDSYITLGGIYGLTIFDNISVSEQKHMDAIKKLIEKYDLPDPVEESPEIGKFLDPNLQALYDTLMLWGKNSLMDSLYVGAAIEETDMIDIAHEIGLADQEDIISTYESLICGSRNHLRAFARQIEANGGLYDPSDEYFVDSHDFFIAIADSPMERDCGKLH